MSGIYGALRVADNERAFVSTIGQRLVFDAVNRVLADYNAEVTKQMAIFVQETTEAFKDRYLLPGGGKLQELSTSAPPAAVKRYNKWDVAFPLRGYGAQLAGSDVDMAYMSLKQLDAHLDTIMLQDLNTIRYRILVGLFEDTNLTWVDPIHGSLTIRRLANTDGSLFPPILGSETDADDQHYWETVTSYGIAEIATALNPAVDLRDEIIEHFGGQVTGGANILVLHNQDATPYFQNQTTMPAYVPMSDRFIQEGADTAFPVNWPVVPGWVHGRLNGCWLSEWRYIPATFMIGIHLGVPAPLVMRVDPADTGLGRGLQLVATNKEFPMTGAFYRHRFGLGCGNRLSAAVIEVSGGNASYAPPSAYAE